MLRKQHYQENKINYILITVSFLISFICTAAEVYYVNYSQTRWYDILLTIDRRYHHICATQNNTAIAGCAFLIFFLFFFVYLTRYCENSPFDVAHIFSITKMKTYIFLVISLILFFSYFFFAFREIRKTTPGNCSKIKQRHDAVYQTWNWNFRENWEKIYDTSFIFYNLVCFHIYRKKINLLMASTIGIFLMSIELFFCTRKINNLSL